MTVALTLLNSMAARDFVTSLDLQLAWGITAVDLKDDVLGKRIGVLDDDEAYHVKRLIDERRMRVHCLSTDLFDATVEDGERAFVARYGPRVERVARIAEIPRPSMVRVLAPQSVRRGQLTAGSDRYLRSEHPWLVTLLRDAVDRFAAIGVMTTVENEAGDCVLGTPRDVIGFFEWLDRGHDAGFTWDVVNLWQMGTPPSLAVYEQLRPLVRYLHVKGGASDPRHPDEPAWRSTLRTASWPVAEIVQAVARDGVSPVICLNPPHGAEPPRWNATEAVIDDLRFLREALPHHLPT